MRTVFVAFILLAIGIGNAFAAGTEAIIKEHAKEIRDQNNVRQGVAPPTQTAPTSAAPAGPALGPSMVKFQTDLGALKADAPATAEQKQKLTQELIAGAQTAKPSQATVTKLADKICAAFSEKPLPATSRSRLVQELDAILNPWKYPGAKPEGIFADIQAIFQENGLARNKAIAIVEDVKTIAGEIQHGGVRG
jgi:hypothetical protein